MIDFRSLRNETSHTTASSFPGPVGGNRTGSAVHTASSSASPGWWPNPSAASPIPGDRRLSPGGGIGKDKPLVF